jgi:dihydrofolate synthase/folylpolyglutamate synthase
MTRTTITRPVRSSKAKTSSNSIRTYRGALNYLDSLVNWERVISANYNSNNFGLARISRILAALGNPHRKFKAAHVAGTKGKGSTVAMLAEMVRACGIKVGVYTSPHLMDIRERIMVDGDVISENAFAKAVSSVAAVMTKAVASPTYFEVLTAAAFKHLRTWAWNSCG